MKKLTILVIIILGITNLFPKDLTRCGFSFWLPDDMVSETTDYNSDRWIFDSGKNKDFFVLHLPITKYTDAGQTSLNASESLVLLLQNGFSNYFQDFVILEVKNTKKDKNSLCRMNIEGNALYYPGESVGDNDAPISVKIFGVFLKRYDNEIKTFGVLVIVNEKKIKDYKKLANKILDSLTVKK